MSRLRLSSTRLSGDIGWIPMRHQGGVALITVLLVLALATVTVVAMSSERQLDIRRTENQLRGDQAWEFVHSLEAGAVKSLGDGGDGNWRKPLTASEVGEASLQASIDDLQGRINLNNLLVDGDGSEEDIRRFKRLLRYLDIKTELTDALLDWMDADSLIHYPAGAEDEAYSRQRRPYRSSNRPFADVSELLLVQGMTREIYDKLRPFVYAVDGYAPINVNKASPEILRCLADDISADQAASMFRASGKPFKDVSDFLKDEAVVATGIGKYGLTVSSHYYVLAGTVDMGRVRLGFASHLRKLADGNVIVIRRARTGRRHG